MVCFYLVLICTIRIKLWVKRTQSILERLKQIYELQSADLGETLGKKFRTIL